MATKFELEQKIKELEKALETNRENVANLLDEVKTLSDAAGISRIRTENEDLRKKVASLTDSLKKLDVLAHVQDELRIANAMIAVYERVHPLPATQHLYNDLRSKPRF